MASIVFNLAEVVEPANRDAAIQRVCLQCNLENTANRKEFLTAWMDHCVRIIALFGGDGPVSFYAVPYLGIGSIRAVG